MAAPLEFSRLLTKPFLLLSLSFQFLGRTVSSAIQTWIDFLRTVAFLHLIVLWRIAILPVAMLSLPIRAFAALYRQRTMEMQVQRMKKALEKTSWDRMELKEQLDSTIQERKMMEMMLIELEDEHDEAIRHVELLAKEVEELKDEIRRLKEVGSSNKGRVDTRSIHQSLCGLYGDKVGTKGVIARKISEHPCEIISTGFTIEEVDIPAKQRAVAMSRTLFSAILSAIVGTVMWQAQDPCAPLVMALFSVVAMSLMSVIQLFSTSEHKPAGDAIALLSFNWFLLGALAYPTLPKVVCLVASRD